MSWDPATIEAARQYHRARDAKRWAEREAYRQEWLEQARAAIRQHAPSFSSLRRAWLFGSIVQPGRFRPDSDIDVAVECPDLEQESAFWRVMEQALRRDVDVRPYVGAIIQAVAWYGEIVYEREGAYPP
ncbi:MAG: nucleotidyltransferase domain-containing protein [Caldilineaceae bacterium]|nr:nucleotidyltransferase domain-containing protein [Caldilineaceae bacterium]